jgi:hypothetical protein
MVIYTKSDFLDLEECHCGKSLFRFHDTSKNIYVVKCAYSNTEYDIKTKKWIIAKKQSCGFVGTYQGDKPVLKKKEIIPIKKVIEVESKINIKLELLFKFLLVSRCSETLQEINLIVVDILKRNPQKIYYYPTTTIFMKESHRESFEDYYKRIFSKDNSDKIEIKIQPILNKPVFFLKHFLLPSTVKKEPVKIIKNKIKEKSHFIDTPLEESCSDDESCSEDSENNDNDNDSDYSDIIAPIDEEEPGDEEELSEENYESSPESDYDYND